MLADTPAKNVVCTFVLGTNERRVGTIYCMNVIDDVLHGVVTEHACSSWRQ